MEKNHGTNRGSKRKTERQRERNATSGEKIRGNEEKGEKVEKNRV